MTNRAPGSLSSKEYEKEGENVSPLSDSPGPASAPLAAVSLLVTGLASLSGDLGIELLVCLDLICFAKWSDLIALKGQYSQVWTHLTSLLNTDLFLETCLPPVIL